MVVTYLAMVSEKGSVASAQIVCSSIAHFQRKEFLGYPSPTHLKVKQLLTAIRRKHGKLLVKREATVEEVRALFKHFVPEGGKESCPLNNWRFVFFMSYCIFRRQL